jgi:tripartite ATP-independent transporter DctM subunit
MLFEPSTMYMPMSRIFHMMLNYALVAVPLFIFMAAILEKAGIAQQLFDAVYVWAGGLRGGLAIGTIVACVIMAAMVGIVGAEIVTFGMIALPQMLKRGYNKTIAIGCITSGGGLATLIPPSVVFIIYGMTAGCSVGELFIAGIIPGLLLAILFIAYIVIACWLDPQAAPAAPLEERQIPLRQKLILLKGLIMPGILSVIVLGTIYAGVATPTEAAAMGGIGAIICSAFNRQLTWHNFREACHETVKISCMLTWLFFGAQAIIGIYTLAGGATFVKNSITALPLGPWGIIIIIQLIWILLGMFLDWIGVLLLTSPLFVPIVLDMGFSNIWLGVVFCMNMHISYLSPPFGPSCFYMSSVTPDDISMTQIYKANIPFLILTIAALALTVAFPSLSLWLPSFMN